MLATVGQKQTRSFSASFPIAFALTEARLRPYSTSVLLSPAGRRYELRRRPINFAHHHRPSNVTAAVLPKQPNYGIGGRETASSSSV